MPTRPNIRLASAMMPYGSGPRMRAMIAKLTRPKIAEPQECANIHTRLRMARRMMKEAVMSDGNRQLA